jgi:acylphosphatase
MMNKCLKITFVLDFPDGYLQSFIQKHAKKLGIEGIAQVVSPGKKIRIIACGTKDAVDQFLDILHKGSAQGVPSDMEVEPFLKDKDYRGVFRVIE